MADRGRPVARRAVGLHSAHRQATDPRADYGEWKAVLKAAGVREARLHDARHTAATFLLVLGVGERAVMDVMGWSKITMAQRYQHVPDEVRRGIATQLGGLLWQPPGDDDGEPPAAALVPA
jgi:integrase